MILVRACTVESVVKMFITSLLDSDLGDIEDKELNDDNYKWIGDRIDVLPTESDTYCVLAHDHMVHFGNTDSTGNHHQEMPLSTFLPRILCEKYNGTLIFGYIHEIERKLDLVHDIPQGVVKLILSYYV